MSYDENHLLESVVQITEERDKKSLIRALLETLKGLINCDAMFFLFVPSDAKSEYLVVSASVPDEAEKNRLKIIPQDYGDQHVERDSSMTSCINSMSVVEEESTAKRRILYPIVINDVVVGVLDVYGFKKTEGLERTVAGFIRIYINFITIIDDNEHDTLTGLLNRKTFDAQLSALLLAANEKNNNVSSASAERRVECGENTYHWAGMLDIDHFKSINDNFGHVYGDEVLLMFSDIMKKTFRGNDLLFRYGGEEFVVVLAPTTAGDAFKVFERFRRSVESFEFPQVGRVTVSIGAVSIDKQEHSATVLENADKALYYAKEHGRNQTCSYDELIKSGALKARDVQSDIELF